MGGKTDTEGYTQAIGYRKTTQTCNKNQRNSIQHVSSSQTRMELEKPPFPKFFTERSTIYPLGD